MPSLSSNKTLLFSPAAVFAAQDHPQAVSCP